ncbi:unnamed protein product [Adineta ricciae]|uniref:Uncharacterized protein n=1 Tax=Adineta ricciae TaxID=249248 RepID=A0A816B558_ADIRI|nr:unnamed protein product [Adineta ricciae]
MKAKTLFKWIYEQVLHYNVFMLEENDYDDNIDPTVALKYQKYKTWLYTALRTVCFYVLLYVTLIKMEPKTMAVSNITPDLFAKLHSQYGRTLSCPCKTTTIPYKNFLTHNVTVHPVCSSDFVEWPWIEGLYFENTSHYGGCDFRTTAHSQFKILSKFCSLSNEMIAQIQTDIANTDLISIELGFEMEIRKAVDGFIKSKRQSVSDQMISFLNYLRTTTQGYFLVTALGTNLILGLGTPDYVKLRMYEAPVTFLDADGLRRTCAVESPMVPAALPRVPSELICTYDRSTMTLMSDSTVVQGFLVGCTPLESLLASKLDCLYNSQCIQLLFDYFPDLNRKHVNPILSSHYQNISIMKYLEVLFVEDWSPDIDFSSYFNRCSPSMCTYTITGRTKFLSLLTLFISVYGGLTIILRLIASYSFGIIYNWKTSPDYERKILLTIMKSIKKLNLFKNTLDRSEDGVKQQRMITRVYLILLFGSICSLYLFASLRKASVTTLESNPELETYNSLESIYSATLRCPCANKAIPYNNFLSFSPVLHPICSSSFVHPTWIRILKSSYYPIPHGNDWRHEAHIQFQILSDLCQSANKTIIDAISRFLNQFFIASSMMNAADFAKQLNATLEQFYQSTVYDFIFVQDIANVIMQTDRFYKGSAQASEQSAELHPSLNLITDETSNRQITQVQFTLNAIPAFNSASRGCICTINPHCEWPAAIFETNYIDPFNKSADIVYQIPGWMRSCSTMDSLLLSTLRCFYQDSYCFLIILGYIGIPEHNFLDLLSTFYLRPLVYDPTRDRHPPDKALSAIVKQMMIEQWNPVSSYEQFYKSCAPLYCSYSQTNRKASFISVVTTLVSMVGGLVVSLRLLTPHLVNFVSKLLKMFKGKREHRTQVIVRPNFLNQVKNIVLKLTKLLRTTLVELNIFTLRDFDSRVDRVTAKQFGRWATRLYLILFTGSISILLFYGIAQPQSSTTNFDRPKFAFYNDLRNRYNDELKCTCSVISSKYDQFVQVEPIFHPVGENL